jgi:rhomboid protease GluP
VLQIQAQVMQDLGANIPYLVYDGQVYRLVTAAFLHANLGHLLGNVVTLYIILTRLEPCYNPGYLVTLYLLAAVSGNVLSDLASNTPNQIAVGASTAIYGYIGTLIAYLIINWAALAVLGPMRSQLACVIGMLTFFSILLSFTSSSNTVDYMGHLGGFVGGLFGSMLLLPPINLAMPKTVKIVGAVVLSVYLLVVFLVFYLAKY